MSLVAIDVCLFTGACVRCCRCNEKHYWQAVLGLPVEWSYGETGHFKGPWDAEGLIVKGGARREGVRGVLISTGVELFRWAKNTLTGAAATLFPSRKQRTQVSQRRTVWVPLPGETDEQENGWLVSGVQHPEAGTKSGFVGASGQRDMRCIVTDGTAAADSGAVTIRMNELSCSCSKCM